MDINIRFKKGMVVYLSAGVIDPFSLYQLGVLRDECLFICWNNTCVSLYMCLIVRKLVNDNWNCLYCKWLPLVKLDENHLGKKLLLPHLAWLRLYFTQGFVPVRLVWVRITFLNIKLLFALVQISCNRWWQNSVQLLKFIIQRVMDSAFFQTFQKQSCASVSICLLGPQIVHITYV